ncbi:unnamed protein product [Clonostachys rosea f. rosea IK726]|uniref:Uncharacterized protein n=1 Tax=Clonostachys rosea f. rosea IK726 TaxID=1349383 RepID=A0ACA9TFF1_BIOOC|nr:unnamed protein product [Clonostachys rosea f. rosea IK726]
MFISSIRSLFKLPVSARRMTTIASLPRMSAKTLSEKILAEQDAKDPTFAIIDVRDDDYIGGHIKGATNVPNHQLDAMMPTLVRRLREKKTVVFHCMLSQIRGPKSALAYLRYRDGLLISLGESVPEDQTVYVLTDGFQGWQQTYGEDERLTEGYRKDLWTGLD